MWLISLANLQTTELCPFKWLNPLITLSLFVPELATSAEPPRGQKRSANSLFSDVPRPAEDPFPESPNGTLSSSLSYDPDDLGEHMPSVVDMFAQHMFGDDATDLCMPATPGEDSNPLQDARSLRHLITDSNVKCHCKDSNVTWRFDVSSIYHTLFYWMHFSDKLWQARIFILYWFVSWDI